MKADKKVKQLVQSISLFGKKLDKGGILYINNNVSPEFKRQLKSIINQAKKIDLD